jgi:uncharacterized protein YdaU (DUF1376 family)
VNYFPFHLGDYTAHTAHLELLEDLAYRRMLDAYYLREGPLPNEIAEIGRLIRMRANLSDVEAVLKEFFYETAEGWRNDRADEEIAKMREKQTKAQAAAQLSVASRKAKALNARSTDVPTDAERTLSERSNVGSTDVQTDVQLPTPTPTPTPGKEARERATAPRSDITLSVYLDRCKADGVKPLPPDHFIRTYCVDAGISEEMLQVAWLVFKDRHLSGQKAKRYKDWPLAFANSVKERWYKLWLPNENGPAEWTPTGLQEKRVVESRLKPRQEDQHEPA